MSGKLFSKIHLSPEKLASLLPTSVTHSMILYYVISIVPIWSKHIKLNYFYKRISRGLAHEITHAVSISNSVSHGVNIDSYF